MTLLFFIVSCVVGGFFLAFTGANLMCWIICILAIRVYQPNDHLIRAFFDGEQNPKFNWFFVPSTEFLIKRKFRISFGESILLLAGIVLYLSVFLGLNLLVIGGIQYQKLDSLFAGGVGIIFNFIFLYRLSIVMSALKEIRFTDRYASFQLELFYDQVKNLVTLQGDIFGLKRVIDAIDALLAPNSVTGKYINLEAKYSHTLTHGDVELVLIRIASNVGDTEFEHTEGSNLNLELLYDEQIEGILLRGDEIGLKYIRSILNSLMQSNTEEEKVFHLTSETEAKYKGLDLRLIKVDTSNNSSHQS